MKKVLSEPQKCPKCNADFTGEPIPKKYRDAGYYGNATHYGRVIGLYDFWEDRVTYYQCPDCKHKWKRNLAE